MRVAIRVRPGAGRTQVGGAYGHGVGPGFGPRRGPRRGPDEDAVLVVRVSEPAVDGRATEAALRALAAALGVRRRDVRLLSGAASRDKVVEIDVDGGEPDSRQAAERRRAVTDRLADLLGA